MTVQKAPASVSDEGSPKRAHRALTAKIPSPGQSAWELAHTRPHPTLEPNQVLVETTYVALNPFDWQGVAFKYGVSEDAKVMGRDGSGVVIELGSAVKRFNVGDRVWFCANSSVTGTGAFQEYSVHSASEIGHTPEHLTDCKAATLGTGLITAGVALFRTLGLSVDALKDVTTKQIERAEDAPWLLIWGGAGITGVYLIELARLLGYRVICSASPVNHEYVRSLGADVVLDRWSDTAELVKSIRKETGDNVRVAIDNVGCTTAALCQQVLQGSISWRKENGLPAIEDDEAPAKLVPLAGSPKGELDTSDAARKVDSLRISFSTTFYGHPEFSEALLDRYDQLLADQLLSPARIRLVPGGLSGIEKGLEDLRHGRVPGGYKLVSRLSDTPDLHVQAAQEVVTELDTVAGVKRPREEEEVTHNDSPVKRVKEEEIVPKRAKEEKERGREVSRSVDGEVESEKRPAAPRPAIMA